MTLIVGVVCRDGIVLCADSQETRGYLKTEINKLPIHLGNGGPDVVIGGAGNGELTDGFRARLVASIGSLRESTMEAVRRKIEKAAVDFHRSPVYDAFPGSAEEKHIAGLICVRTRDSKVMLFDYFDTIVKPVETYKLAGEDYAHFDHIVKRLYRSEATIQQGIVIGLEVMNTAKATSVHVGGETRVVVARSDGMRPEHPRRINAVEAFVKTKREAFDSLTVELGSSGLEVEYKVQAFANSITSIRKVYGVKFESWPDATIGDIDWPEDDGS
jgi:hypothetical protein